MSSNLCFGPLLTCWCTNVKNLFFCLPNFESEIERYILTTAWQKSNPASFRISWMSNLFQDIILLNILLGIWLDYKSENQWRQRRFFAFTFGKSNKMAGLLSDAFAKSRTLLWKSFSLQKSLLSGPTGRA